MISPSIDGSWGLWPRSHGGIAITDSINGITPSNRKRLFDPSSACQSMLPTTYLLMNNMKLLDKIFGIDKDTRIIELIKENALLKVELDDIGGFCELHNRKIWKGAACADCWAIKVKSRLNINF